MTTETKCKDRDLLKTIAHRVMIERGFIPDFPRKVIAELDMIRGPAVPSDSSKFTDLRNMLWCSLDNDDSLDLDQLTASKSADNGAVKILVAIADVDAIVKKESAIDMQDFLPHTLLMDL